VASAARALRLFLAAALLAGWQAALVHPLEHADGAGRLVHLSGGGSHEHEGRGGAGPLCDAIAALAVCVQGRDRLLEIAGAGPVRDGILAARAPRHAPLVAYRSQAPPQLS
jgi:hypothetical protein